MHGLLFLAIDTLWLGSDFCRLLHEMPKEKTIQIEKPTWVDSLYDRLAEDDEGRVCTAISDEACRATPGNFFLTLASNTLTSIGDRIASAKTTLPWILGQVGAPGWMVGVLVPIRESGSMLPPNDDWRTHSPASIAQMGLGGAGGSLAQGLSLVLMGLVAMKLGGFGGGCGDHRSADRFQPRPGRVFSGSQGCAGEDHSEDPEGRLTGWTAAAGGLGALLVGLGLGQLPNSAPLSLYAGLLGLAALFVAHRRRHLQPHSRVSGEMGGWGQRFSGGTR